MVLDFFYPMLGCCGGVMSFGLFSITLRVSLSIFFGTSHIIFIPKVEQLDSFVKFRPISLCVVAYKIFLKILVSRLTLVLPKLISKEHGGFCQR